MSPAIWCPATADCAQQAPRHPRAPPAAAPGAYSPGLPSVPLPGAAGPEAPAGMPGATWHSPGSLKVHPQPSLPTCSRCCLQACISCRWLCSKASRSHSAASRSLCAASRLRPSMATSFCQRAASHCGGQGRGQGSSGVSFLMGATLPWESSAGEGEPGAHLSARLLAWHCPIPKLSLEEQAVLSSQPLPLRLGQGVLDLQGRARLAPAPCLAEGRAGLDSIWGAQCCWCRRLRALGTAPSQEQQAGTQWAPTHCVTPGHWPWLRCFAR